jgi:hypothetical protein
MRLLKFSALIIFFLLIKTSTVLGQPIPVELMMGHKYGTVNFVFDRRFSQNSRFGFFHINTIQFDYKDKNGNSFFMQDVFYMETLKNLRIAGGVVYSPGGFNTTAGLQYVYGGRKLFFLCAPRVNFTTDASYEIMSILQYKPDINDHVKLYTRFELLHLFNSDGNIKSYQWFRLGLEVKGIQFGLAADIDEYGPKPSAPANFGLFLRKEIF